VSKELLFLRAAEQLNTWPRIRRKGILSQNPTTQNGYLLCYEKFMIEWDTYEEKRTKACGTICVALEPSIGQRYWDSNSGDPKILWDTIKADFEKVIQLDGKHEQQKLVICKPEDFVSVRVGLPLKTRLYTTFAICGIAKDKEKKEKTHKRQNRK
jgi:hypothetical protein